MHESVKTVLLAAIGALALSYEKAAGVVDDMVKKGQLTVAEGKQINEELKRTMKGRMKGDAEERAIGASPGASPGALPQQDGNTPLTLGGLRAVLGEFGLATRADVDELKDRLSRLEKSSGGTKEQ